MNVSLHFGCHRRRASEASVSLHRTHHMSQEFLYHGEFISDGGVEPVARALAGCSWRIELQGSGYDGTLYLRTPRSQEIDIEMDSGQSRRFLFSVSDRRRIHP
jgi:hypothetical protein